MTRRPATTEGGRAAGKPRVLRSAGPEKRPRSSRSLDNAVDVAPDHLFVIDRGGRVVYVSPRGADTLGLNADCFTGRSLVGLGVADEVAEPFERRLERVFSTGSASVGEVALPAPGRDLRVAYALNPVHAVDGSIPLVAMTFRAASTQCPGREEQLESAVEQPFPRRRGERAAARLLERQKDEFFAAASHDLKTPLTTIKGEAQLLRRMAGRHGEKIDEGRMIAGLAAIDVVATRMAAILNELLDITWLRMGRSIELDRRRTDLVALAERVAGDYRRAAVGHRLEFSATPARIVGHWDADRLERVIAHLLATAIAFTPAGGTIGIDLAHEETGDGSWAVLTVRDDGPGIPEAEIARIFDQYHHVSGLAGPIRGSGMGLASIRHVVDRHGGTITVTSKPGAGTKFVVRLPTAVRSGAKQAAA